MKGRLLIKKYFEENSFVKSNIESFNNFILWRLQRLVDEIGSAAPAVIPPEAETVEFKFGKIYVGQPQIVEADGVESAVLPTESRLRDLTYSAPVFLEITLFIDDKERDHAEVQIFKLPVMLKSKLCYLSKMNREELIRAGEDPDDPGGYFIINGTERNLILLEDLAPNTLFVKKERASSAVTHSASIYSSSGRYKCPITVERKKDGTFWISFSGTHIPLLALLKALGMTKDKDIVDAINIDFDDEDLYVNLYEYTDVKSLDSARNYIAKELKLVQEEEQKRRRINYLLDNVLLPHIGSKSTDRLKKALYLCRAIRKILLLKHKKIKEDTRDHYMNKRVRLSGDLLGELLRVNLKAFVNDLLYVFQKSVRRGMIPPIYSMVQSKFLTQRINSAMATGSWTGGQQGVSQKLERDSSLALISHLQRVSSLLQTAQENFEARELHPTHFGRLCPVDSPEGKNIGLRKQLAMLASITPELKDEEVNRNLKILEEAGIKPL